MAFPFAMAVMPPLVVSPVSSPMKIIIIVIEGESKERESKGKGTAIVETIIVAGPTVAMEVLDRAEHAQSGCMDANQSPPEERELYIFQDSAYWPCP